MSQSQTETVLITGAGGWLGSLLPETLIATSPQTTFNFILVDLREPTCKVDLSSSELPHKALTLGADLAAAGEVAKLFQTALGVPDTIYSLHGIMSLGSELDFDLGIRVNFDSTRQLLDAARSYSPAAKGEHARKQPITFVFTSSVATYGGPIPDVVLPSTACTPEGAYGMAKLMVEYLVTEYSRRGFIDGRSIKLPTVVIRPGPPSVATSAFVSGIVREPLAGQASTCPIGSSADDPILAKTGVWVASPRVTLRNFARARLIPADRFPTHSRSVQLPGFTTTVRDILDALVKVTTEDEGEAKAKERLGLVRFEHDETCRRIVSSWPREFDVKWAVEHLGFEPDASGIQGAVREFKKDYPA